MFPYKRFIILIILLLSACSAPVKEYSDQIYVKSSNYKFIDELFAHKDFDSFSVDVPVWVSYPDKEKFSPPYPAIVLLHSSWGLSAQESYYANIFRDLGLAVYAIDSFTPRGVKRTSIDQSLVSSAAMIQDAYQVLAYLHKEPLVNANKVAVMGFSKGGIVAFYSAFDSVQNAASQKGYDFAAHIAYYPWCGMRLNSMRTSNAPILLQGGDKDIITPVKKCEQLVDEELNDSDRENITIKHHRKARHAFDHPILARVPFMLALDAQVPALCDLRQMENGEFIEKHSDVLITGENIKAVLEACSNNNGNASSHRRATRDALEITKSFLSKHILN